MSISHKFCFESIKKLCFSMPNLILLKYNLINIFC